MIICGKCNHNLPDDSEFCQYCGGRIEKENISGEDTVTEIVEEVISDDETTEVLNVNTQGSEKLSVRSGLNDIEIKEKKELTEAKIKYCSRCGSMIDNETKICSGCGKQYFRGIRLTKYSLTVVILSITLMITIIANIVLSGRIDYLEEQKGYTVDETEEIKEKISDLEWENAIMSRRLDFYDEYVAIVGDDGSNKYHKYGCEDLDTSSFWVYSVKNAKQKGHKACPECN